MTIEMRRSALLLTTALAGFVCFGMGSRAYAADQTYQFDIPAESLGKALNDFSQASAQQIIFSDDAVAGRRSPGLHGNYTVAQALNALLSGTDLVVETNSSGVLMVKSKKAQAASNEGAVETAGPEMVTVTGTRIRGAEPVGSRLDVYSRTDIEQTGAATLDDFARQLPENFSSVDPLGGASNKGNGFTQTGGNSYGGTGFNLRGLGPQATLTLLDGNRLAPAGTQGAFIDTSMIPLAAIDRVEILPDEASAIYGADAVAGVVNIELRKDFDGAETTVRYGGATEGGADEFIASQLLGMSWSDGNIMVVYNYDNQNGLFLSQRNYIPPQPQYNIIPQDLSNSLFVTGHDDVFTGTTVTFDLYYSDRVTHSDTMSGTAISQDDLESEGFGGIFSVEQVLPDDWSATFTTDVSVLRQPLTDTLGTTVTIDPTNTSFASVDLVASGPLFELPGGELRAAIGSEYRDEGLKNTTTVLSKGVVAESVNEVLDRHISSYFAELNAPLIGEANNIPFVDRLTLSAAVRYDHYTSIGGSTDPKFGAQWAPIHDLTFRASYGQSFHPPLLTQLVNQPLYIAFNVTNPAAPGGKTDSIIEENSGNPDLQPETSRSHSAGFDFTPSFLGGLDLSGTYWDISYRNRITLPPITNILNFFSQAKQLAPYINTAPSAALLQQIEANPAFHNLSGLPNSDLIAIFNDGPENVSASREDGIDGSVRYGFDLFGGQASASFASTYLLHNTYQVVPGAAAFSLLNDLSEPIRFRAHSTAGWSQGPFSSSLTLNYWGSYENPLFTPAQPIGSWTTLDVYLSYRFADVPVPLVTDNLAVSLSVQNILDEHPPGVNYPKGDTPLGFDPSNASLIGRVISVQLRKDW